MHRNPSGGEAARLHFLPLDARETELPAVGRANEPLGSEAINALNIVLQKSPGTVLLVTHDHDVVEEVATRIWHFENREIEDFKGSYADYLAERGNHRSSLAAKVSLLFALGFLRDALAF